MAFDFDTPFLEIDPACVPKFARTFQHVEWIDGESIVQAESTPTEEGFNARFHKIIADLDALAEDARRGLECTAAMRASVFDVIAEAEKELDRLGTPVESWKNATLLSGWDAGAPDDDFEYSRPGYFKDPSGIVHLHGIATGGLVPAVNNGFNSPIFQLPAGYRPAERTLLHCHTGGLKICRLDIAVGGEVLLRNPYSAWVSLDGLSFRRGTKSPGIIFGGGG